MTTDHGGGVTHPDYHPICATCGWRHDPTIACKRGKDGQIKKYRVPDAPKVAPPPVDPFAKYRELEQKMLDNPTKYTKLDKTCPHCGTQVYAFVNCMDVTGEAVNVRRVPAKLSTGEDRVLQTHDEYDAHERKCAAMHAAKRGAHIPELTRPRRSRKDIDD